MSISRFSLREKVTLRLLKLYFNITDVAECSKVLIIRLSDEYQWCEFKSRRGKNTNL